MNSTELKQQKQLLEKKGIELENIPIKTIYSQMNLRGGRMNQPQRQQDQSFREIITGQKKDVKKKILSITNLIQQRESDDFLFGSSTNQIEDFSIMKTPTRRKIKTRGRIQQHMGYFLE